jgi:hypothetical protein
VAPAASDGGSDAPLALPWRDAWDLDEPFPNGQKGDQYSRWTEGPVPPAFGGGGGSGGSGGGGNGGGSGVGRWSAGAARAKAQNVLALLDGAEKAADNPGSAQPRPRGKWARTNNGGDSGGSDSGSGNNGGDSGGQWSGAKAAVAAVRVRGLLDDDLGAPDARSTHTRLGPPDPDAREPELAGAVLVQREAPVKKHSTSDQADEEPLFVVPASFVSPYVNSEQ